jgi:hypothetical protein
MVQTEDSTTKQSDWCDRRGCCTKGDATQGKGEEEERRERGEEEERGARRREWLEEIVQGNRQGVLYLNTRHNTRRDLPIHHIWYL